MLSKILYTPAGVRSGYDSLSPFSRSLCRTTTTPALASSGKYENQILPSGFPSGTPEEALDCACRLYLDNPLLIPSSRPPRNFEK